MKKTLPWYFVLMFSFIIFSIFFSFLFQNSFVLAQDVSSQNSKLSIMSWNLNGECFAAGNGGVYACFWRTNKSQAIKDVMDLITQKDPDLIFFNAIADSFGDDLLNSLKDKGYKYSHVELSRYNFGGKLGNAIISKKPFTSKKTYNTSGWREGYQSNCFYPSEEQKANYCWASAGKQLSVDLTINNKTYSFFNAYLGSGRIQNKLHAEYFQNKVYKPLIEKDKPHFLISDLNMLLDAPSPAWYNAYYLTQFPQSRFFNIYYKDVCQIYKDSSCVDSVVLLNENARIDHILFRDSEKNKAINLVKAYIFNEYDEKGFMNGIQKYYPVEHYPIFADFVFDSNLAGQDSEVKYVFVPGDYNGDDREDKASWNPVDGVWYIKDNNGREILNAFQYGGSTMIPVPGDYDGDNVSDLALWNPVDGMWYIYSIPKNRSLLWATQYGTQNMIPVPGDYDGDDIDDLALWDTADGMWYIYSIPKKKSIAWAKQYGSSTMTPVSLDYDKDGANDMALKNTDGKWYIFSLAKNTNLVWGETEGDMLAKNLISSTQVPAKPAASYGGASSSVTNSNSTSVSGVSVIPTTPTVPSTPTTTPVVTFPNTSGMKTFSGDYNGDGNIDVAYWNPTDGKWYIKSQLEGSPDLIILNGFQYGASSMQVVPGDYDGDGSHDLALWNKPDGMWYIYSIPKKKSIAWAKQYGSSTMTPVSLDYDKDGANDMALKNTDGKWYIFSLAKNTNLVWGETNINVTSMNSESGINYATALVSWDSFIKLLQILR